MTERATTVCEGIGRLAIVYFGLRASQNLFLAGAVAGVGYYAWAKPEPLKEGQVHLACGEAVERLSGVQQPQLLKLVLMTSIFLYHMDHALLHKLNIYIPAGGWLIGCFGAKTIFEDLL